MKILKLMKPGTASITFGANSTLTLENQYKNN